MRKNNAKIDSLLKTPYCLKKSSIFANVFEEGFVLIATSLKNAKAVYLLRNQLSPHCINF